MTTLWALKFYFVQNFNFERMQWIDYRGSVLTIDQEKREVIIQKSHEHESPIGKALRMRIFIAFVEIFLMQ